MESGGAVNDEQNAGSNGVNNAFGYALKKALSTGDDVNEVVKTFTRNAIRVANSTLFVHPGLPYTLDTIDLDFESIYVGKPLHMLGYLIEIGSDDFILIDNDGNVYRAEDSVLHVVGNDVLSYFVNGPNMLGYYDFYDHLDHKKGLPCAGGSSEEEVRHANYDIVKNGKFLRSLTYGVAIVYNV